MRKLQLVVAFATFALALFANKPANTALVYDYIARFQQIAMLESARSGIPASIILAQGIVESKYGTSDLAVQANNHFGIKWKSANDGEYISVYDDDYDKKGNRIPSRFIRYNSAEESYRHHTEFLKGPRYARLFDFDRTDYRNWAHGLSSCHYASDPSYPTKLIRTIETYQLDKFDIPMLLTLEEDDNRSSITVADYQAPQLKVKEETQTYVSVNDDFETSEVPATKPSVSNDTRKWESKAPQQVEEVRNTKSELYEIITETNPGVKVVGNKSTSTAKKKTCSE
jgi:hypothetical protein